VNISDVNHAAFKAQVSAAALFNLLAHCEALFSLLVEKGVH